MNTTLTKRMHDFFDFGFEQLKATPLIPSMKQQTFFANAKDFSKGGKYERFANYTREQFEKEFCVSLQFS